MGWTGIPMDRKPTTEELNRVVDDAMRSDTYQIVDRSGFCGWDHQFLLCERRDGDNTRFIAVFRFAYRSGELLYSTDDESAGPNETDCPERLLRGVEGSAPRNAYAAQWRQRCREKAAEKRGVKELFKKLERADAEADRTIVLTDGTTATFAVVNHRGKRVKAYRRPGQAAYWRLEMRSLDVPATMARHQMGERRDGSNDVD